MKIIGKKGNSDTYVQTIEVFNFTKILIISLVLIFALIAVTISYIESLAPIPANLEEDLIIARLTNVCLASNYENSDLLQQNILDLNKLTEENLNNCFTGNVAFTVRVSSIDESINKITAAGSRATVKTFARYTLIKTPEGNIPGIIRVSV